MPSYIVILRNYSNLYFFLIIMTRGIYVFHTVHANRNEFNTKGKR